METQKSARSPCVEPMPDPHDGAEQITSALVGIFATSSPRRRVQFFFYEAPRVNAIFLLKLRL